MAHSHHDHHHGHSHGFDALSVPADSPHARLLRLAGYAAVSVATLLLAAKLIAWWRTDSLSMLSSLTDSAFDLLTSLLNLLAIRYALKPADNEHRFGHTRIEDIAGLAQFTLIAISMGLIVVQSVGRLLQPQPVAQELLGMGVSAGALLLSMALVAFQTQVARRTGSLIVASDRAHYASDIAFNLGVLAALGMNKYLGLSWADPAVAILIALAVVWHTREIGLRAFRNLMDHEMPASEQQRILAIAAQFPQLHRIHRLKTRYAGTKAFIQMHVEIDGELSLREAHSIIDQFEHALLDAFAHAEIIIHPDPIGGHRHA